MEDWSSNNLLQKGKKPGHQKCSFVIVFPGPVSFYIESYIDSAVARMGEVFTTQWLQHRLSGHIDVYFFQHAGHEVVELIVAQSGKPPR